MTKNTITVDNFYDVVRDSTREYLETYFNEHCTEYLTLRGVPKKYQSKVRAKAWEDGHSYGYVEVAIHLLELADIFE